MDIFSIGKLCGASSTRTSPVLPRVIASPMRASSSGISSLLETALGIGSRARSGSSSHSRRSSRRASNSGRPSPNKEQSAANDVGRRSARSAKENWTVPYSPTNSSAVGNSHRRISDQPARWTNEIICSSLGDSNSSDGPTADRTDEWSHH